MNADPKEGAGAGTPAPTGRNDSRNAQPFGGDELLVDLKGRSVRGGAITLTAQVLKFLLQTGSTIVLARLLTPAEFGLIAMVAAVTGFAMMFKDAGLSMATIQRAEITHGQVSNLFWVNVGLSTLIMMLVAALAPVLAWFYEEPRLVDITLALSVTVLFGGLTVQHQALLRRQMRFKDLVIIEITSLVAGIATAVIMALGGCGYWSLVGQIAATTLVTLVLVWKASGWRPGRPVRGSGVRAMLSFGGYLTGTNTVNYLSRNLDNLLIGWRWGAVPLGIYSKAYSLLLRPLRQATAPLNAVVLPVLSRLNPDPKRFRSVSLRLLRMVAMFGGPPAVLVAVFAEEIVAVLLGDQWMAAVPIIRWLSLVLITQVALNQAGNLFIAQGRADVLLRCGLINATVSCVAFVVGLPWGPLGVAVAYSVSGVLLRTPILLYFLAQTKRFSQRDLYTAVAPSVAVAFAIAIVGMYTRTLLVDRVDPVTSFILVFGVVVTLYGGFYLGVSSFRNTLRQAAPLLRQLRPRDSRNF